MWVTKLLISPVKKRIFCPKTTKFSPKLAFLSIAGSFGAVLVGWLVVVARAVSRKTPIYFIKDIDIVRSLPIYLSYDWLPPPEAHFFLRKSIEMQCL